MKLFNLFRKETTNSKKVSFQRLEKNQLKQVIGGADDTTIIEDGSTDVVRTKSRSNIRGQKTDA